MVQIPTFIDFIVPYCHYTVKQRGVCARNGLARVKTDNRPARINKKGVIVWQQAT